MRIRSAKEQTSWTEMCAPMADYMRYCRELQFAEEPDYERLLDMLRVRFIEEQNSTTLPKLMSVKCEACRALNNKDTRPKIERIEEENSVSPPSEPKQTRDSASPTQPSTSYPLLNTKFNKLLPSNCTDPAPDALTLQMDGIKLNPLNNYVSGKSTLNLPKRAYYLPPQNFALTQSVKLSQSSLENLSNLSANMELSLSKKANSEDDDANSVNSCQNCRQQKQSYFDEEFAGNGEKLSWQIWRDSTPENRFDYENRWTLLDNTHFPIHGVPNFSCPPPLIHPAVPSSVPFHHFPQQYLAHNNGQNLQFGPQNFGYGPLYQQPRVCYVFPPPHSFV